MSNLGPFRNVVLVILFVFLKNICDEKVCKNMYNIV